MNNEITLIDGHILKSLKRRDEKAIAMILDSYGTNIKSVIWYHLRTLPLEDKEECMNNTLLDIWTGYPSFDSRKGVLKNWICGVAKYNALDVLRKRQRSIPTENLEDYAADMAVADEIRLIKEEAGEELDAALSVLNEIDKKMIQLHYLDGISIKEIALRFGLKEQTAYKRIERAIKKAGQQSRTK